MKIAVIGGPDFGVHGEGYLRLSYATHLDRLREAVERMRAWLPSQRIG